MAGEVVSLEQVKAPPHALRPPLWIRVLRRSPVSTLSGTLRRRPTRPHPSQAHLRTSMRQLQMVLLAAHVEEEPAVSVGGSFAAVGVTEEVP